MVGLQGIEPYSTPYEGAAFTNKLEALFKIHQTAHHSLFESSRIPIRICFDVLFDEFGLRFPSRLIVSTAYPIRASGGGFKPLV